jgi:AcrR family transcriptional regulator
MASRTYNSSVRAEQAERTRRTIIDAALTLFSERGYSRTSVAAVADEAGVALNTVYSSVGGKSALINAINEQGLADEAASEMLNQIEAAATGREIIQLLAEVAGQVTQRHLKALALLLDNRTAHPDVAAAADLAIRLTRERVAEVADRLCAAGGVRPELSTRQVAEILWFYFGFDSWRSLRAMKWSWRQATAWLAGQAANALLGPADDA